MKTDHTILSYVFGENGTKELSKILDYENFPFKSKNLQLAQAAQTLSKSTMSQSDKWEPPFMWESDEWERLCSMPYIQRIAYATSFLSIEFQRLLKLQEQAEKESEEINNIDFEDTDYEMPEINPEWDDLDKAVPPMEDQDLETSQYAKNMNVIGAEHVKPIDEEMSEAVKRGPGEK